MLSSSDYLSFVFSLLALLTPFAAIPVYLTITKGLPAAESARTATAAAVTAAFALITAAVLGRSILAALGTSIDSLRVGGGLVLLLMTFSMLAQHETSSHRQAQPDENTATDTASGVVPLGLPLLAGPGAISSVIVEMDTGSGLSHNVLVIACIVLACCIIWMMLRLARSIARNLGPGGLVAVGRVFGFLTAAVAVEIITTGLRALFPVLDPNWLSTDLNQ